MHFNAKPTLYVLPHGIEVIGEYPPKGKNRYWRVRIRPHQFFPNVREVYGGYCIRRSRVVMASILGRALSPKEHVHHRNENRDDDRPENLELIDPVSHNQHHKTGSTHTEETKQRISEALRHKFKIGEMKPRPIAHRNAKGQITSC